MCTTAILLLEVQLSVVIMLRMERRTVGIGWGLVLVGVLGCGSTKSPAKDASSLEGPVGTGTGGSGASGGSTGIDTRNPMQGGAGGTSLTGGSDGAVTDVATGTGGIS